MTVHIGRFTPYEHLATSALGRAVTPPAQQEPDVARKLTDAPASGAVVDEVPPAPSAEAREMVEKAAERVEQLYAEDRELHFSREEGTNRVIIQVRDLEGNVIKTIPPSKALDIMSGAEL